MSQQPTPNPLPSTNRKRYVQVNVRLTPEEVDIWNQTCTQVAADNRCCNSQPDALLFLCDFYHKNRPQQ